MKMNVNGTPMTTGAVIDRVDLKRVVRAFVKHRFLKDAESTKRGYTIVHAHKHAQDYLIANAGGAFDEAVLQAVHENLDRVLTVERIEGRLVAVVKA